ncbi:MAG: cell division protein FtsA [bacterium]|nr:cell division protein FtsA [bacterium]
MKERLLVGLDLGSSHIRVAVGQVSFLAEGRPSLNIIGATEAPSSGISKGNVSSFEDAVSAISHALEQAERLIGVPIEEAYVGIGGTHISALEAKGVIGVSRPDGDIRSEDVTRVLEAARAFTNQANQEILHVLARSFSIDGQGGIKDPVGMQGIRLEVEAQIVQGMLGQVRNLTKAVFRTGLDITELVYAPLAALEAVTDLRKRELGVCVLNIGASTTGIAVYEDGDLLYTTTIPIGSEHVTSDIAIGLRVSLDVAEKIKRAHGSALPETIDPRSEIDVRAFGGESSEIVSLQYIGEIIEARIEELFEKVELELKKIDRSGLLPAGVILTGGGAKLPGMVEVGKRVLQLPCSYGVAQVETSMPELVHDPRFSVAVGLVMWGFDAEKQGAGGGSRSSSRGGGASNLMSKVSSPFKKVFKSFLP